MRNKIFVSYKYFGRIEEHCYEGEDSILIEAPLFNSNENYDGFMNILQDSIVENKRFDVVSFSVKFFHVF